MYALSKVSLYKSGKFHLLVTATDCEDAYILNGIQSSTYLIAFVPAYCRHLNPGTWQTMFGLNVRASNYAGDVAPLLADLAHSKAFSRWRDTVVLVEEPNGSVLIMRISNYTHGL